MHIWFALLLTSELFIRLEEASVPCPIVPGPAADTTSSIGNNACPGTIWSAADGK